MEKNKSAILLVIIVILMGVLLACAILGNRDNISNKTFNYKKGDVITIEDKEITVLNVSEIKCARKEKCNTEIETSIKIKYHDVSTYYVLQSFHKPSDTIKETNLKVYLNYTDDKISFEINRLMSIFFNLS